MSNSNKIWDTREAYKQIRNNTWSRGAGRAFGIGGTTPSATNIIDVVNKYSYKGREVKILENI